jgi:hypothetical protein
MAGRRNAPSSARRATCPAASHWSTSAAQASRSASTPHTNRLTSAAPVYGGLGDEQGVFAFADVRNLIGAIQNQVRPGLTPGPAHALRATAPRTRHQHRTANHASRGPSTNLGCNDRSGDRRRISGDRRRTATRPGTVITTPNGTATDRQAGSWSRATYRQLCTC